MFGRFAATVAALVVLWVAWYTFLVIHNGQQCPRSDGLTTAAGVLLVAGFGGTAVHFAARRRWLAVAGLAAVAAIAVLAVLITATISFAGGRHCFE
jgi:hypothetical protein